MSKYFCLLFVLLILTIVCVSPVFADDDSAGFSMYKLVKPLGVATLIGILVTVALGLSMRKKKKVFKLHRITGILSALLGIAHATIVMLLY